MGDEIDGILNEMFDEIKEKKGRLESGQDDTWKSHAGWLRKLHTTRLFEVSQRLRNIKDEIYTNYISSSKDTIGGVRKSTLDRIRELLDVIESYTYCDEYSRRMSEHVEEQIRLAQSEFSNPLRTVTVTIEADRACVPVAGTSVRLTGETKVIVHNPSRSAPDFRQGTLFRVEFTLPCLVEEATTLYVPHDWTEEQANDYSVKHNLDNKSVAWQRDEYGDVAYAYFFIDELN